MFGAGTPVYIGHENVITLVPYSDLPGRRLMDLSGVFEVRVCLCGQEFSSDNHGNAIYWEAQHPDDPDTRWLIHMRLGLLPDLQPGQCDARIVVYDGANLEGVVLGSPLSVELIPECG